MIAKIEAGQVVIPPALIGGTEVSFARLEPDGNIGADMPEIINAAFRAYQQNPDQPIVIKMPGITAFIIEEIFNRNDPVDSEIFWRDVFSRIIPQDLLRDY